MNLRYLRLLLLWLLLSIGSQAVASPFGLKRGMTRNEVIRLVGKGAVITKESRADYLVLNTVPQPYSGFKKYILYFSPTDGLLKIMAVGNDVSSDPDGHQLLAVFRQMRNTLTEKYGEANDIDEVTSDSQASDFMVSLQVDHKKFGSIWGPFSDRDDRLTYVQLEARAFLFLPPCIDVSYEYEGWAQYIHQREEKKTGML